MTDANGVVTYIVQDASGTDIYQVDGITYDNAKAQWETDNKSYAEFERYWAIVDSNGDGEIVKEDLYTAMSLIPEWDDNTVETSW